MNRKPGFADIMVMLKRGNRLLCAAALLATGWLMRLFTRDLRRALGVSRGQTEALTRTLRALTAEPGLDAFLGQVLTASAEQLGADWVTLWFYDGARDVVSMHMTYDHGNILTAAQLGAGTDELISADHVPLWQELVQNRRPIVVENIAADPRLRRREALLAEGVRTLLVVPLLLGDTVLGWMSIRGTERRGYGREEIALAQALSHQVTLAVQLARLAEDAQQTAILAERNRMAREIHDTLAQGFTGIVIQLEAAEDVLGESPEAAQAHLARARSLARESLAEARRSVWALRPVALEQGDLVAALARSARELTAGAAVTAQVQVQGSPRSLPPSVEDDLLRIGQEALTNALKHAHARALRIELSFLADSVRLSVHDDGRGFTFQPDVAGHTSMRGFGLMSMRERAERLGGQLTIRSRPGAGTEIVATVPLTSPAAKAQNETASGAPRTGPGE